MNIDMIKTLGGSIDEVKKEIRAALLTSQQDLRDIINYTLGLEGKLIRPALTILTARIGESSPKNITKAGAAMEILHMASLVHDDIIDEAEFRRHKKTIFKSWGGCAALLTGDYFYTKAMGLLCQCSSEAACEVLSVVSQMIEGELEECSNAFNAAMTEEKYIEIVTKKTSSLIGASCYLGARLGGLDEIKISCLKSYGTYLGIAYQIMDDCLDYEGTEKNTGKCKGKDLLQGVTTLPLIYYIEACGEMERKEFIENYHKSGIYKIEKEVICSEMKSKGILGRCKQTAGCYADKALEQLECIDDSAKKGILKGLCDYVITRNS